jgi:ribosomal protein L17
MAYKKGQSGNPLGRALMKPWRNALERALAQFELKGENGEPVVKRGEALRIVADTVVKQAVLGDKDARREIAERLDGKPLQEISGNMNVSSERELSTAELERIARTPDPEADPDTVH